MKFNIIIEYNRQPSFSIDVIADNELDAVSKAVRYANGLGIFGFSRRFTVNYV